jgi:hypothetical protein
MLITVVQYQARQTDLPFGDDLISDIIVSRFGHTVTDELADYGYGFGEMGGQLL